MAWPITPLTTYVPSSTPTIKASDLNAFQEAINKAFLGMYSYAGIVMDGTGGASVSPLLGGLRLSATAAFGTSAPTPAHTKHDLYKYGVPVAMGAINSTGPALFWGYNISAIARPATGRYDITLLNGVTNTARVVAAVAPFGSAISTFVLFGGMTSATVAVFWTRDTADLAQDNRSFSFVLYGD